MHNVTVPREALGIFPQGTYRCVVTASDDKDPKIYFINATIEITPWNVWQKFKLSIFFEEIRKKNFGT